jgi:hypothetical protein
MHFMSLEDSYQQQANKKGIEILYWGLLQMFLNYSFD